MPRAAPVRRLWARSRAASCHAFILGCFFFSLAISARESAAAETVARAARVVEGWLSVWCGGGGSERSSRLTCG